MYYIVRDAKEENHVIAIHMIYDSAMACFQRIARGGAFERYVDLFRVTVNDWGEVTQELLMYSFAKHNQTLVNYMVLHTVDVSGETPRLTIRIP